MDNVDLCRYPALLERVRELEALIRDAAAGGCEEMPAPRGGCLACNAARLIAGPRP
jgi:hypothetical protein